MKKQIDFILDTISILIIFLFVSLTVPLLLYVVTPQVQIFAQASLLLPDPRHMLVGWICVMCIIAYIKHLVNNDYQLIEGAILDEYHYWFVSLSLVLTFYLSVSYGFFAAYPITLTVVPFACYISVAIIMTLCSYIHSRAVLMTTRDSSANLHHWKEHKLDYIVSGLTFWIITPILAILGYSFVLPKIHEAAAPYIKQAIIMKRSPHIDTVRPIIAYPSDHITFKGSNFGYLQNNRDSKNRVVIGKQPITPDSWSSEEIAITVPLDVRPGTYKSFVSAAVEYNGSIIRVKSNVVEVQILSRTDGWDEQDDKLFNQ